MAAVVDKDACVGCGACKDECPVEAIEMVDDVAVVNADDCTSCGACVEVCPVEAITIE